MCFACSLIAKLQFFLHKILNCAAQNENINNKCLPKSSWPYHIKKIKDIFDERRRITCFRICPRRRTRKGSRWDAETSSAWHLESFVIYTLILGKPIQYLCLILLAGLAWVKNLGRCTQTSLPSHNSLLIAHNSRLIAHNSRLIAHNSRLIAQCSLPFAPYRPQ